MRVFEGIRQEESKNEAAQNSEGSHDRKEPEPPRLSTHTPHMQNSISKKLRTGLTELVSKVEEHDTLGRLFTSIPSGQSPEAARDETRLCHTQKKATSYERAVAVLKGLESADGAEEEQLEGQPFSRADTIQYHIGGNLEEDDAEGQHLLSDIELILTYVDVS